MKQTLITIAAAIGLLSATVFLASGAVQEEDLTFDLDQKLAIAQGNSLLPTSNPTTEPKVVKKMSVVVTAYSSTVWETDDTPFTTAAGTEVRDGIIANNLFPFGTKVRIPDLYGNKVFVVEDRMNQRMGHYRIDIWFPSNWEAKLFGVENTYIEVLES